MRTPPEDAQRLQGELKAIDARIVANDDEANRLMTRRIEIVREIRAAADRDAAYWDALLPERADKIPPAHGLPSVMAPAPRDAIDGPGETFQSAGDAYDEQARAAIEGDEAA